MSKTFHLPWSVGIGAPSIVFCTINDKRYQMGRFYGERKAQDALPDIFTTSYDFDNAQYAVAAANLCNGDLTRIAALLRLTEGIPTEELENARAMVLSPVKVGDYVQHRLAQRTHGTVHSIDKSAIVHVELFDSGVVLPIDSDYLLLSEKSAPSLPAAGNEGGER